MIIISWDVGVLHLAYCVIEYLPNKNNKYDINILDWDIINLVDNNHINLVCCGTKKINSRTGASMKCYKRATHYLRTPNNKIYGFCKIHSPQHVNYLDYQRISKLFVSMKSENKCDYLKKNNQRCGKNSKYFLINNKLYYCTSHYKILFKKKIKEYSLHPIKKLSVKNYPTSQLQLTLIKKLDQLLEHFSKLGIEEVIIENQPTFKNPKMKSLSNTLFDYFLIRGHIDRDYGINIKLVRFICPSNKLKVKDNTIEILKQNKKEQKYKLTKKLAIQYTKELLSNNIEQLEYLDLYPKKDDLCDAYLQGRYYLEFIRKQN